MTLNKNLETNRDEILRIAASHGAQDLRVFGSVSRGEATDKSDVDILIKLEPGRSLLTSLRLSRILKICSGARSMWSLKTQSALTFASKSSGTLSAYEGGFDGTFHCV